MCVGTLSCMSLLWREDSGRTFAQLKVELVVAVAARVELAAVQQRAHIVHKHLITRHGHLAARALLLDQLQGAHKQHVITNRHTKQHVITNRHIITSVGSKSTQTAHYH